MNPFHRISMDTVADPETSRGGGGGGEFANKLIYFLKIYQNI